ncbi:hypothetical protein [Kitasatospora xanthocidica]|uniref:hypothetical protein n=1 Tax=Kitasatospora xanthocidica TaxID=83382 RepID=UPI0016718A81|nr:hypothetical protein [Kitasatospora xanthocidica]
MLTRNSDFEQRAVVRGPYGTRVLPGRPGATLAVDEESWTLSLEYLPWDRRWRPNVRVIPGPLLERDGVLGQLLTSSDQDFPGKPLDYPNFVLRLDRVPAHAPVPSPAATRLPAATQTLRTSSDTARVTPLRPAATPPGRQAPGQGWPPAGEGRW